MLSDGATLERFCDRFAAELLLPTGAVERGDPTAARVVELHRTYDVSVEVAARSVAEHFTSTAVRVWRWSRDGMPTIQWASNEAASRNLRPPRLGALGRNIAWLNESRQAITVDD
jgi:Zn-dependent peptidase ImmA (M78 family)